MPTLGTRPAKHASPRTVPARLFLALATVAALLLALVPAAAAQEVPELRITSTHYIVIDAATGEVFAQRGAHDKVAIASLTKVLTAIEAIESAPSDLPITTTEADLVSAEATTMGFAPGETFTLQDLIYGMLLPSGNDAAWAIARALGAAPGLSDQEAAARFVARINERVRNMGLSETTLVNPDGWGVPGHHSSAHDLAVFAMYALRYPRFVEAISAKEYVAGGAYRLTNTNKMLDTYDGILGGKTGYDNDAGYCLIEVAQRDGSTMISVTLDGVAPDDWYDDNRVLLDYAFDQKAARGGAVVGERVGFLDPDAALVERIARAAPAGSLGAPASVSAPPAAPNAGPAATASDGRALTPDLRPVAGAARGPGLPAAVAVATALVLLPALRALRSPARPKPRAFGAPPASGVPSQAGRSAPVVTERESALSASTMPPSARSLGEQTPTAV